jgi:hypothetical protein
VNSTNYHHLKEFGEFGENYTRELLEGLGIVVKDSDRADLKTGRVTIEVKIATWSILNPERRKGYQFCLRRDGHTEFDADFLVCLCCPTGQRVTDAYIIPRSEVDHKRKLVIPTDDYHGKWKRYHDAFDLILSHPDVEWRSP